MLARAATAAGSAAVRSAGALRPALPALAALPVRQASTKPAKKSRVLPKEDQTFVRRLFYGDVVSSQVRV